MRVALTILPRTLACDPSLAELLGLTAEGMTPEPALAAALLYRIATYCLPPVWGVVALRRLQRGGYL